jgi:hypothetical protein
VKCLATIRHSNTDPDVAVVAIRLNMVPIIVDRSDPDRAVATSFLLFVFVFSPLLVLLGQVDRPVRSRSGNRALFGDLRHILDGQPSISCCSLITLRLLEGVAMGQKVRFAKAKPYVGCAAQNLFEQVAELRQLREQVRQAEAMSRAVATSKVDQQGYRKRRDREPVPVV